MILQRDVKIVDLIILENLVLNTANNTPFVLRTFQKKTDGGVIGETVVLTNTFFFCSCRFGIKRKISPLLRNIFFAETSLFASIVS